MADSLVVEINPVAKPRMTRSDRWNKRPVVVKYWDFKNRLTLEADNKKFILSDRYKVVFNIKMPDSWSNKKKAEMNGKPHQQCPDLDNFIKALNDALKDEDSSIYMIQGSKYWSKSGSIVVNNI